ncbi:unnamed protein product [Arctogadus glacialis]
MTHLFDTEIKGTIVRVKGLTEPASEGTGVSLVAGAESEELGTHGVVSCQRAPSPVAPSPVAPSPVAPSPVAPSPARLPGAPGGGYITRRVTKHLHDNTPITTSMTTSPITTSSTVKLQMIKYAGALEIPWGVDVIERCLSPSPRAALV